MLGQAQTKGAVNEQRYLIHCSEISVVACLRFGILLSAYSQ